MKTDFAPEVPAIRAYPLFLQRVLQNRLENAIKFSPGRSKVRLEVRAEDHAVRFAVYDQGPGIGADDLGYICEIFYRGQREGDSQGFGLGVATVKRIIDAHGGRIWVDTAPGRGCTFFLTVPLEKDVPEDASRR